VLEDLHIASASMQLEIERERDRARIAADYANRMKKMPTEAKTKIKKQYLINYIT
jgi:hypothetical protein